MPKQIITDTFETLGQAARQSGKQVVGIPFKIAETAASQIGVKPQEPSPDQPLTSVSGQAQQAQKKAFETQKLTYLSQELQKIKQRQAQEPGFSPPNEENVIKQLEEEKKKEPLPIVQAKRGGGTGERRIKGVSG